MPYVERLKDLLKKDSHNAERKTNNESGPAGPLNINKARDWEISWNHGRAVLLRTPRVPTPEGESMPDRSPSSVRPELDWDRGGSNTGPLPDDPNGPVDKIKYKNKDRHIIEESLTTMSYVSRLARILAKAPLSFRDVLMMVKALYPDLKMKFPQPPTYVWNPKKDESDKDTDTSGSGESDDDIDDTAKLEPQKIKDRLKVKLPQLKWTARMSDGIEQAELGFDDESSVLFEIGADANHLTLTYNESPKKGIELKHDDSLPDDGDDDKDT